MNNKAFRVTAALGLALIATSPVLASRLRLPPARTPAGSIYSPAAIAGELAKRGYRIETMKRKGTAYSVTATGPHGNRVQMLVDGRSGDIVGLTVLQAAANFLGVIAAAMTSGKSGRYYDDTRPFGVIVPDRYQVNWTVITVNDWTGKRGAPRYVSAPLSGRGYRYAVPYRTVRPAAGGGTRSTYGPKQMSRPLYDVYDSSGTQLESIETREDAAILSQVTTVETRFSSEDERFESSYETSYFGSDVDEASIEQTFDYDAEDGDYDFADNAADGYDAEVDSADFSDYAASVDDDDDDDDGVLDSGEGDDADADDQADSGDDDDDQADSGDDDDDQGDDDDGLGDDDDQVDDDQGDDDPGDDDQGDDDLDDDGGDDGGDEPEFTLTSLHIAS